MLAQERRNLILEKLQEEKRVIVSDLSKVYNVSEETIRRDLEKLEKDGYAVKSYGGATLKENLSIDLPFNIRKKHNTEGKQIIASLVANLINDGEHITLDASSTAVFVAKAIKEKKNITMITNSLEVLYEVADIPEWQILSPGGVLRPGYLAFVGSQVEKGISSYRVEKAIFSCKGLDVERGISEGNESFALVKSAMIKCSKERILAVDSSKFDENAFVTFADLSEINVVVTDKRPSEKWMDFFEKNKTKCIYPK